MSWSSAGEVCMSGSFGCVGSSRCCDDSSGGRTGGCGGGASEGHAASNGVGNLRDRVFGLEPEVKFFAVFPQTQIAAGDIAYLDRYGELCTRAEMVKATAAMNNLSDLNSLGSAIMAIVYGGDRVKFSCAAESIIGRCIRLDETHQCWKNKVPELYQCQADKVKSEAMRARMRAMGI